MDVFKWLEIDTPLNIGQVLFDDIHHLFVNFGGISVFSQDNIRRKLEVTPLIQL